MKELYKEIGKYFFNLSLLVNGGLLLKQFAENRLSQKEAMVGLILSLASFCIGYILYRKGIKE